MSVLLSVRCRVESAALKVYRIPHRAHKVGHMTRVPLMGAAAVGAGNLADGC